jgi:Family of unknown function (DUF5317)
MFLVVIVLLSALAVPLLGGRLEALAEVRARLAWTLLLALGLQVMSLSLPGVPERLRPYIQLASYPVAGVFVIANRRLPGMLLVGLGALLNLVAMSANGGVMPASAAALDQAGLPQHRDSYANSTLVRDPRLGFLGDVFAIPDPVPLANVFSVGDVCIGLGLVTAVHGLTGSRPRLRRSPGRHVRRRPYQGRHQRVQRGRGPAPERPPPGLGRDAAEPQAALRPRHGEGEVGHRP